jgi:signal transduction histidine kinase
MSVISTVRQRFGFKPKEMIDADMSEDSGLTSVIQETVNIAPTDPLLVYLLSNPNIFDVNALKLDSPALRAMQESGVQLAVPLVSQGELIGLLSLGPRLSDQEYSIDDRHLLKNLAAQAAPALRSAQLIQQQKGEAAARERMEQELKVARVIQQTLLPAKVPLLAGWELDVFWQPAYSVGGDFYDFITLDDGRMCVIAADVQLQQVVLNLLRNALDAMSSVDDRPRDLRIKTERDEGDRVRLSVTDAGVGFDPRATARLFEAFYSTKDDGMGVGLSVSRSIIESHQGRLWAVLNDGPGATFSFSIPGQTQTNVQ